MPYACNRCLQVGPLCCLYSTSTKTYYTAYCVTGNDADESLLSGAAVGTEVYDEGPEQ